MLDKVIGAEPADDKIHIYFLGVSAHISTSTNRVSFFMTDEEADFLSHQIQKALQEKEKENAKTT